MKVKFKFSIGVAGCDREEIVEYPNGTKEKEIGEDVDLWADQFIFYGYEILEGE